VLSELLARLDSSIFIVSPRAVIGRSQVEIMFNSITETFLFLRLGVYRKSLHPRGCPDQEPFNFTNSRRPC
jgi:hypothetical protein